MSDPFVKAGKLATKLGFRWYEGMWPSYTPRKGHAADTTPDLCHELGHYLVSPKWLRNRNHFGLGYPSGVGSLRLVSLNYAYHLEQEASILGIVLQRECGDGLDLARGTADEHSWQGDLADAWKPVLPRLQAKGLWSKARQKSWLEIVESDLK